jgi:hypothetical protein
MPDRAGASRVRNFLGGYMKISVWLSRRSCAMLRTAVAVVAAVLLLACAAPGRLAAGQDPADKNVTEPSAGPVPAGETLQSEFLFDLVLERGTANNVGSAGANRVIVPVASGTFNGPRLKGTVVAPSGDWIVARPDGSSVLDLRLVLQTDDGQKIYMASRGVAFTPAGGAFYARIVPAFETGAAGYAWLNNVVAVGVYRPLPGKVAYRIYQIL